MSLTIPHLTIAHIYIPPCPYSKISRPLTNLYFPQVEIINQLQLLTAKPVIFLINLSEKDYIRQKNKNLLNIKAWIDEHCTGDVIIPLSVAFEERLTRLTDDEVAAECKKLGVKSAIGKIVVAMRAALRLASFFTTGPDEVRQWSIRKGTKAPQAAGVIHTGVLPFLDGCR